MKTINKQKTLYLSVITLFLVGLLENISKNAINVAMIPLTKAFDLNPSQIGLVLSCFFATYSIMTFLGGVLSDKLGAKKVLAISVIAAGACSGLIGMVTSFAMLIALRCILGITQGVFPAASSVAVAELFSRKKRGTGKSIITSSAPLGSAFGAIAIGALTNAFGWRVAFAVLGVVLALVGAIFFLIYKPTQPKVEKSKNSTNKMSMLSVFKIPLVWKLVICNFGFGVFLWGMVPWLPTYFSKVKHLDMVSVATLSSIPPLASFVFMIFGGVIIDKYLVGREKLFISVCCVVGSVFVGLTYTASTVILAFTYYAVANVVLGVAVPLVYILVLKYLKNDIIGQASGIVAFSQQFAGVVAPMIMGSLVTYLNGSYGGVFVFVIVVVVIVAIVGTTINIKKDIPDEFVAEIKENS